VEPIRKRLTYANVMSTIAVFLVLGGGAAVAASQLAKNSVGKKQLKANAVTTAKIKKNAVTSKKIGKNAVTGAKVKDASLTGADINLGTLGTVPSATTATTANTANTANNLAGLNRFNLKLGFGQSKTLFTAGPFTFTASCHQNESLLQEPAVVNRDIVRILISTNANGQVFDGLAALRGEEPTKFLDIATPEKERIFLEESVETGKAFYEAEALEDGGAYSPSGTAVSFSGAGFSTGINVYGAGCFLHGFAVTTTEG
jgi:hypothetical protein